MIRVAIADDHSLVRDGIKRMLSSNDGFDIVGEAGSGLDAIELCKRTRPDVLVLDISMPAKDGIDTSTEISELGLPTRVLIVTMHSDEQYALRTLRAGASGFCCKGARSEELVHAVREVAAGRRYLPPHIQNTFADRYLTPATKDSPVSILSQREFQVMCHLAAGMTNREIAEQLQISVKTVDTHRGHVLKKLQLRNNSDITRFAIRHGFVEA